LPFLAQVLVYIIAIAILLATTNLSELLREAEFLPGRYRAVPKDSNNVAREIHLVTDNGSSLLMQETSLQASGFAAEESAPFSGSGGVGGSSEKGGDASPVAGTAAIRNWQEESGGPNEEEIVEFDAATHTVGFTFKDTGLGVSNAGMRLTLTATEPAKTKAKMQYFYDMDEDKVVKTISDKGGITGTFANWFPETSKKGLRTLIQKLEDDAPKNLIDTLERIMPMVEKDEL